MKKLFVAKFSFLFLFLIHNTIQAQNVSENMFEFVELGIVENGNSDFENWSNLDSTLQNVDIVLLGEQSHGDATSIETKIKFVKYLHQNLGFEILAFESGLYDCNKAWENIENGGDVKINLAKSIFFVWATTFQIKPLYDYLEQSIASGKNPLKVVGFDSQISGKFTRKNLVQDLKEFCKTKFDLQAYEDQFMALQNSIILMSSGRKNLKKYKKEQALVDTKFIDQLVTKFSKLEADIDAGYWIQVLKSLKIYISDNKLGTDLRDKQMAENLIWLKDKYPKKKIICWGATSHFLYNSENIRMKSLFIRLMLGKYYQKTKMMGSYLKEKYNDKLYSIGFVAHEGSYGIDRSMKLSKPKQNSLEYLIGKTTCHNCFVNLDKSVYKNDVISRPLSHKYMKNEISKVMDGVIFNRYMKPTETDVRFFLQIYPENKYLKLPEEQLSTQQGESAN